MTKRTIAGLFAGLLMLTQPLTAAAEVEWLVAPYVFYSDVSLDLSTGASGGVSASDLLDKSDTAGMIRIEAAGSRWGVTFDSVWLGLSKSTSRPWPGEIGRVGLNTDLDISINELGAFYRLSTSESGVDLLFGGRNINTDATLIVIPNTGPSQRFDASETHTDAFVGARLLQRFGNKWDMTLRGDYSFGDTEGSLNLLGTVGYRFNDTFAMNLGYRHFAVELEDSDDGESVTTDITLSGPVLGFLFRF